MPTAEETQTMETVLADAMNIIIHGREEGMKNGFPVPEIFHPYNKLNLEELQREFAKIWVEQYRAGVHSAWARVERLLKQYKEGKGFAEICKMYDRRD